MITENNWTGNSADFKLLQKHRARFDKNKKSNNKMDLSARFLSSSEANFLREVYKGKGYTSPSEVVATPLPILLFIKKFFYNSGIMFVLYFILSFYFSFLAFEEIVHSGGFMTLGLSPLIGVPMLMLFGVTFASAAIPPLDMMMINYIKIEGDDFKPTKTMNFIVGILTLITVFVSFFIFYIVGNFLLYKLLPILSSF